MSKIFTFKEITVDVDAPKHPNSWRSLTLRKVLIKRFEALKSQNIFSFSLFLKKNLVHVRFVFYLFLREITYLIKETAFKLSSFSLSTLNIEFRIKLSVSNSFKKYFLKKYLNLTLYSNRIYTKKGKIWRRFTTTTSTQRKIQIPCTSCKPICFCFLFLSFILYLYLFINFILYLYFILIIHFVVHDIFVIPTFHRTFPKPSPES